MSQTRALAHPNLAADRVRALALTPVSRETAARLDRFVQLLLAWQETTQLIASSTVGQIWTRHIADSLQILDVAPDARRWVDLGSGGGFPGLVLACALAGKPGAAVHLVESNTKKAAFLREAARLTAVPARVYADRIETFVQDFADHADVVTARAVTPLKLLLDQSCGLLKTGTLGVFPKGQDVEAELTHASKYWNMAATLLPSRTDPKGRIVLIRALERRVGARE
jgi:16S rRNA (guanine527-N7)-methyltransferase